MVQNMPLVTSLRLWSSPQDASVDECVVAAMRWGLIPSWFRENDPRKMQYSTNNCRSESLLDKKSYKVDTLAPLCYDNSYIYLHVL